MHVIARVIARDPKTRSFSLNVFKLGGRPAQQNCRADSIVDPWDVKNQLVRGSARNQ